MAFGIEGFLDRFGILQGSYSCLIMLEVESREVPRLESKVLEIVVALKKLSSDS